jgi:hypothetical protein
VLILGRCAYAHLLQVSPIALDVLARNFRQ